VAILTDELMIHPDSPQQHGPMAWIFNTFSFSKVISQNTLQLGRCFWDNNVLMHCGSTLFSMVQFRLMLSHFITESKSLIAKLMILPDSCTGLDIPTIHWENNVDNLHDTTVGYSFLLEPRNTETQWCKLFNDNFFLVHMESGDKAVAVCIVQFLIKRQCWNAYGQNFCGSSAPLRRLRIMLSMV
jgi:hypothetical protein